MSGSNSIYCKFCNKNCKSSICTLLVTSPDILFILLNRDKEKYNIDFNENLNLQTYIQYNNTGCNYKLIGLISYNTGINVSSYFFAYCRDSITDKWYKYDDNIIDDVNDFKNEVIDSTIPFLLLYQKIKLN